MGFIEEQIKGENTRVAIARYRYFFNGVNLETTLFDFSEKVFEVWNDERLSLEDKKMLLTNPLRQHAELLTLDMLEKYVDKIHKDPVLLTMLFKYFSTLPIPCGPDLEIVLESNSVEVWTIRKMLCALRFISPDEMWSFATHAMDRFEDSLPGWMWMKLIACQVAAYPVPQPVVEKTVVSGLSHSSSVIELVFVDPPKGQGRAIRNFGKKVLAKQNENPECLVASR